MLCALLMNPGRVMVACRGVVRISVDHPLAPTTADPAELRSGASGDVPFGRQDE
jgi:hypothetical protein